MYNNALGQSYLLPNCMLFGVTKVEISGICGRGTHEIAVPSSLVDLKHTVQDVKRIANLNGDFSDQMIAGLNRILLDVN